ncbi:MAG: acyl-CoA dehydrogenase [Candidatus Tectimicrobiota bacterium]|nr:MAG: acyl-CoA dehydrogenase [Candidatus Tectomicrobia bacterium]
MDLHFTPEEAAWMARVQEFAQREVAPYAARWDETEHVPRGHVQKLADFGLFGLAVPKAYGGHGRTPLEALLAIEAIAEHCGVSGRLVVDHNFGPTGLIRHYGSEAQKHQWLPRIARGEVLASICITEPHHGSDANQLETCLVEDGKGGYRLSGHKRWITGAGERELYVVLARFGETPGSDGIGCVLVPASSPGVEDGPREPTLGLRGLREAELFFREVPVTPEQILVPAGPGSFRRLMQAYNGQRVGAAMVATGIAKAALKAALAYAQERHQFGRPIADFQAIQFRLADMAIQIDAARYLCYRAIQSGDPPERYAAGVAKTFAAEMAIAVTNSALQVFGGNGYSRRYPIERLLRDARMFTLGGGTVEIQRLGIARALLHHGY